jgi:hypothetical protein
MNPLQQLFIITFLIVASWIVESATGETSLRRKRNLIDVEQGYVSYGSWNQPPGKKGKGLSGKGKKGKGDTNSKKMEPVVKGFYLASKKGQKGGKGKGGGGPGNKGKNGNDDLFNTIPAYMSMNVPSPPSSLYNPPAPLPKSGPQQPPVSPGPAPVLYGSPSVIPSPSSPTPEFTPIPTSISSTTSIPAGNSPTLLSTSIPTSISSSTSFPVAPTAPSSSSLSPVKQCESLSREQALLQSVSKVTDLSLLKDTSTPAGKAYQFLLNGDPAKINPCTYPSVNQRFALVTFYYSTNGDSWSDNGGWLTAVGECQWMGITCNTKGLVTDISLSKLNAPTSGWQTFFVSQLLSCTCCQHTLASNNLSGPIPNEIRALTSLVTLNLFDNLLTGTLPDIFTNFPDLALLDVEVNNMQGSPFVSFTGVSSLVGFRVSFNNFTGPLPPSYGQLTKLQEFWISNNAIAGTIPVEFGALTDLGKSICTLCY